MGKINGCLKCLFIFFNVVFAIIGFLLIYGLVQTSAASKEFSSMGTPGVGWSWIFAIGVVSISGLGIFAGCSEKPLALKIFAGFMVSGIIVMIIFGIYVAVARKKLTEVFTTDTYEMLMRNDEFRNMLRELQKDVNCCGLQRPEDWGSVIPDTCSCSGSSSEGDHNGFGYFGSKECKARPQGTTGPDQIYVTTCGNLFLNIIDLLMKITMGFCFGFAVTAFLGLLVTWLMLHQIKRHNGNGPAIAMKNY